MENFIHLKELLEDGRYHQVQSIEQIQNLGMQMVYILVTLDYH